MSPASSCRSPPHPRNRPSLGWSGPVDDRRTIAAHIHHARFDTLALSNPRREYVSPTVLRVFVQAAEIGITTKRGQGRSER
jgi:hypothetical protein